MTGAQQAGAASAARISAGVLVPTSVHNFHLSHTQKRHQKQRHLLVPRCMKGTSNYFMEGFAIEMNFGGKKNLHVL